jgi:hypothetical protein
MGFSIVKIYKESLPDLRFVGKRYVDADRVNGSFGAKWGEFHQNGWFDVLERNITLLPEKYEGGAYLGFMRMFNGAFEYWIGMFAEANSPVPEGFESIDVPAGEIATAWIYGREDNGEIYGMEPHNASVEKFTKQGWQLGDSEPHCYSFERYQCPRFTTDDGDGRVILDYCIYLK